jgi:NAD(P)-dependent dehydrogenase (short-subunit alcohol dehydrogenase family)
MLKEAGLNDKQIASVLGPIEREDTAKELIEKTIQKFGRIDVLVLIIIIYLIRR